MKWHTNCITLTTEHIDDSETEIRLLDNTDRPILVIQVTTGGRACSVRITNPKVTVIKD